MTAKWKSKSPFYGRLTVMGSEPRYEIWQIWKEFMKRGFVPLSLVCNHLTSTPNPNHIHFCTEWCMGFKALRMHSGLSRKFVLLSMSFVSQRVSHARQSVNVPNQNGWHTSEALRTHSVYQFVYRLIQSLFHWTRFQRRQSTNSCLRRCSVRCDTDINQRAPSSKQRTG